MRGKQKTKKAIKTFVQYLLHGNCIHQFIFVFDTWNYIKKHNE